MPLRLNAAQAPSDYYPETHAAPQECQRKSRKKKFKYTSVCSPEYYIPLP